MPVHVITSSVRGWGHTEAEARAKRRLNQFNEDQQADRVTNDRGTEFRITDPGNGGPCAAERIPFEFFVFGEDLPEFSR